MALFLAFGNQKGGVGKTTCTVLAANALSQHPYNYRVTVVDVDPQKSIVSARAFDVEDFTGILPYDVLDYNLETFLSRAEYLDRENDLILVDMPGRLDAHAYLQNQEITPVLNWLDFLFIPFTPGNFTLEAGLAYIKYLTEQYNPARASSGYDPLKIIGFSNMHRKRRRSSRSLLCEIDEIKQIAKVPFMRTRLNDYTLFRDADTYSSFYDESGSDPAKLNFTVWVKELHQLITHE